MNGKASGKGARAASQAELNKFVEVVDEFKAKYARLQLPATRQAVYASGDQRLISDYETTLTRAGALDRTIDTLVGAWGAFKRGYAAVTDRTSTVIGDAIDEIRSWFGYDPAPGIGCYTPMGSLAGLQIPAAVAVAGVISAAMIIIAAMNRIFTTLEANRIQRENPDLPRSAALEQARRGLPSFLPAGIGMGTLALGALALWLVLGDKRK
jgi:hypothetical protein